MGKVCANEQISDSVIQQNSNGKRRLPATDSEEEKQQQQQILAHISTTNQT